MSDPNVLAAQREARRKKITQNAQARMNKLLGNKEQSDIGHAKDVKTESLSAVNDHSTPQSSQQAVAADQPSDQVSSSPYNLRRRSQRSGSPTSSPSAEPSKISSTSLAEDSSFSTKESSSMQQSVTVSAPVQESSISDHLDSNTQTAQDASFQGPHVQATSNNVDQATRSFDAKSLEWLRIAVCVMTAFISRTGLKLGLGLFMINSIFLPFIAMETLFIYTMEMQMQDAVLAQSKGTMMSAALMLCGIKPELMGIYHKIMAHVAMVSSDFAVYLFTFVVLEHIMS